MIDRSELERFVHQYIAVGVPHDIIAGKLFFYFGTLKSIDGLEIKIQTKVGFKIIPLADILDIHMVKHRGRL